MGRTAPSRSLRTRLLIWRARLSVPTLLSDLEENKLTSYVTALNGGLAILTISLFAWLSDLPLAFPALGPTAFILFSSPFATSAAPRSVVLGHGIGIACGCTAWLGVSMLSGGAFNLSTGGWAPIFSGSVALALTGLLLVRWSCPHPPACASALVLALGGMAGWLDPALMMAAVVILTGESFCVHRLASMRVPLWSPRTIS